MCPMCAWCQWLSVDDVRSPGTGMTAGCESLRGCWTRTWIFCKSNTSLSHLFSPDGFQAPRFYRHLNKSCRMIRLWSNHKKKPSKDLRLPPSSLSCTSAVSCWMSLPLSLTLYPSVETRLVIKPGAHQFSQNGQPVSPRRLPVYALASNSGATGTHGKYSLPRFHMGANTRIWSLLKSSLYSCVLLTCSHSFSSDCDRQGNSGPGLL